MIQVDFYTFSKRTNSTKKPTGTAHSVSVTFKEPTDIEKPTLELHDSTILAYNYAYIAYTGRYYFVSGRRSIAKDTFEIDLVEDYLASAIDSIRGQNVYCAMSSVDYNVQLDDKRVVPVPTVNIETKDCPFEIIRVNQSDEPQMISVSAVITDSGAFNGVDVIYAWDVGARGNYIKNLADPTFFDQIRQNMGGGNPMDYVCEVWATILSPTVCHDGVVKGVLIGDDSHPYEVAAITDLTPKRKTHVIDIPTPSYTDFRFSERFVKYYLVIPFIGIINIPTQLVRDSQTKLLNVAFGGDIVTGQYVFTASVAGVNLGVYGTSLKTPLPLNAQASAGASMLTNGIGAAATGAATGAAAGGIWGAVAGAASMGAAGVAKSAIMGADVEKTSSSVGSISAAALYKSFTKPTVIMFEYPSDIDPATLAATSGRPCEKVVTVKNGYMQTRGASLSFAGTDNEINAVNRAFDTGVYVE